MPELPEVQTVVDGLIKNGLPGALITGYRIGWSKTVAGLFDPEEAAAYMTAVTGQRFAEITRRGKYIRCRLDHGLFLVFHLRMTGRLYFRPSEDPKGRHEHLILSLDMGRDLRFHDTRKFGRALLTRDAAYPAFLGPEPLDAALTEEIFHARLQRRNRQIKPLLLDQSFLAGLGNIYTDEALWLARIHPRTVAGALDRKKSDRLLAAIREVLEQALTLGGTSLADGNTETTFYSVGGRKGRNKDHLNVFRRTGEACPACGGDIERIVVGQRGTHICPRCQRSE